MLTVRWGALPAVLLTTSTLLTAALVGTFDSVPEAVAAPSHRCFGMAATIVGTSQGEDLLGTRGTDVIVGFGGDDFIDRRSGRDFVCAGVGSDVIQGRSGGSDKVRGAAGFDRIYTYSGDDMIFGGPGPDEITTEGQGKGDDVLYGGAGNDYLAEREGDDRLNGGTGDDVMDGSDGSDVLQGGRGDDSLGPGKGRDVLRGGRDEDRADYWQSGHPIRASLVDDKALGEGLDTLHSIEGLFGSKHDDHLVGDSASNELSGGAGYWYSRRGDYALSGSDAVVGGGGDDVIDGTWNFTGQRDGRDKLGGGRGNDLISGGPNDDTLIGGPGTDTFSAQRCIFCRQYRYGFSSPVIVNLKQGTSFGVGRDRLRAFENVRGSRKADRLIGDGGNNDLLAGPGDDTIRGRGSSDFLDGGRGHDSADGGAGVDKCREVEKRESCGLVD